ncbi:unnamed protein product [Amoebophrya sp. A25]|nr:unnamed protein product [Amoebophrya sp. A25]|eukprot:GSA25T00000749001.1
MRFCASACQWRSVPTRALLVTHGSPSPSIFGKRGFARYAKGGLSRKRPGRDATSSSGHDRSTGGGVQRHQRGNPRSDPKDPWSMFQKEGSGSSLGGSSASSSSSPSAAFPSFSSTASEPSASSSHDGAHAFVNPRVWFDVSAAGRHIGRLEIELFYDVLPVTCENFRALCTGETGLGYWCKPRWYKGVKMHRIIPGFMAQGGDFNYGNGLMGESIYGKSFRDEGFVYKHSRRGVVSMAKAIDKHTNNSQFFFTFGPLPHLDGKHIAFGHVVNVDPDHEERLASIPNTARGNKVLFNNTVPPNTPDPVVSGGASRSSATSMLEGQPDDQAQMKQVGIWRPPNTAAMSKKRKDLISKMPRDVQGSYVLDELEKMGTEAGFPRYPVEIWNCGEYDRVRDEERFLVNRIARPDKMDFRISGENPIPNEVWKRARRVVPPR